MDWIAWDDTLETGDAAMDAEHRQMARLFDQLRSAAEGGAGKAACTGVLDEIIGHAKAHFEREQHLMTELGYPGLEQHAAEHAMLLRQAREFKLSFGIDSAASRAALFHFPEIWLTYHILFSDKDLAAFLVQAGKTPGAH